MDLTGEPFVYSDIGQNNKKDMVARLQVEDSFDLYFGKRCVIYSRKAGLRLFGDNPASCSKEWIDDDTMNAWGELLQQAANVKWRSGEGTRSHREIACGTEGAERHRVVLVLDTYLMDMIIKGNASWMKSIGKKCIAGKLGCSPRDLPIESVYEADLVMMPVSIRNVHWVVVAFDFVSCVMYLLDPLGTDEVRWQEGGNREVVAACKTFLEHGGQQMMGEVAHGKWEVRYTCSPPLPVQRDSRSCGPISCAYMHHLCNNRRAAFSVRRESQVSDLRWFIGHCIFSKIKDSSYVVPI